MFRRPVVTRRGPGLLGAVALGGIVSAAGHSGATRAAAEQRQAGEADRITQLEHLGRLRDSGVLTADEFEREKQRVLA